MAWTKEESEDLATLVEGGLSSVQDLAKGFGKSVASVRAKIARMAGPGIETKEDIINALVPLFGLDEEDKASLMKARKATLQKILAESLIDMD